MEVHWYHLLAGLIFALAGFALGNRRRVRNIKWIHPMLRISGDHTRCVVCGCEWDTNDVHPPEGCTTEDRAFISKGK